MLTQEIYIFTERKDILKLKVQILTASNLFAKVLSSSFRTISKKSKCLKENKLKKKIN